MSTNDVSGAAIGATATISDYFFAPFVTPQARRLQTVSVNGVQHASEISPRDPLPEQPVALSILTDAALPIDHVAVYFTGDGSEPEGERGLPAHGHVVLATPQAESDSTAGGVRSRHWQAWLPGQPDGTLVQYRIDAWCGADPARRWLADAFDHIAPPAPAGRIFAYHVDRREAPDWVYDAIVYHIFVDRFAAAADQPPLRDPGSLTSFFGGTLRGITEKLDYLAALGVNCLWLSPVMESPTYHSYNPTSFDNVSPRFGTNADLRELIARAHARGMRVLLDFIANHTSNEHPAFLAAQGNINSPYADWYAFGPGYPNGYLTYYNVPGMPVLRTDAAPVRDYLIAAARRWLSEFGADGLRLDNVSGPTHAFWTIFQEGVKASAPDALTLGEVTGGMADLVTYGGRLDACMDFPLARVIRRVFAQRSAPLDELLVMLQSHEAEFAPSMAPARILDNHDMHRFLWLAEGDTRRLMLALTFLMALPGIPILYYGTEVGLSQRAGPSGKDAYAREPMPWGNHQNTDVLQHTRWLIAQRTACVSLRRGRLARIPVSIGPANEGQQVPEPGQAGALARWTNREASVVIFNNSEHPMQVSLAQRDLPIAWQPGDGRGPATDAWLLTPDGISRLPSVDPTDLTVTLPALSAVMILPAVGQ